ncbi:hypothetical protein ABPG74_009698 [Tetrahymena malaccensis]
MDKQTQNEVPQKVYDIEQNKYNINNILKLNDVLIEKQNDVQQTEIQLSKQNQINIVKVDTYQGINSQKECQTSHPTKHQQQSSNQTERQQKEQTDQLGNLNNHSLEQSTAINTFRSSQNVYIQNYDTAGICEQNFCYCFTHTVDVITLLLAFFVGRTAHRQIFFWRIIISLCFDIGLPILFLKYFNSLQWYFIFGQMCLSFIFLFSSLLAISQETHKLAKFSLAINVPFVSLFKIIIRCSNNLFCREDQVNTANYLSHRPIISLYLAHIAKSAILSSTLISYITVLSLTMNKIDSFHNSELAVYIIFITLYSLDLLRNAYQAIVAENNHRLKSNAYKDISYKRSFSNELAQDVSIQNYDNQNKYKQDINQLLEIQNIKQQKKIIDENAKTNKISSLYVNNNQIQQKNGQQVPSIEKQKSPQGDLKKLNQCNYRGLVGYKISESNNDVVFYDKSKDLPEDQMLQSLEIQEKDQNQQQIKKENEISPEYIQQQQQKEDQIKHQMNELLKQTLNDNKFQYKNQSAQQVEQDKENQNQFIDLPSIQNDKSFTLTNQKMENLNFAKQKAIFSKTIDCNHHSFQVKVITEPNQQSESPQYDLSKLNKLNSYRNSAQSKSIDFL